MMYQLAMDTTIDLVQHLIEAGIPEDLKPELNKTLENLRNLATAAAEHTPNPTVV